MAYPHNLRALTNQWSPEPTGVCDRCYFYYPLEDLRFQYDVRGKGLATLGIRVCPRCYDEPAWILLPIEITGPEGFVRNPRPPQYGANAQGGQTLPTVPNFPIQFELEGDQGGELVDEDTGAVLIDEDTGDPLIPEP